MGLRDTMNDKPVVVTIVVLAVLVVAVVVLVNRGGDVTPGREGKTYFYDAKTRKVYLTDENTVSPAKGGQAFKAHMYACGKCTPKAQFVGYVSKYSDEARQIIDEKLGGIIGPHMPLREMIRVGLDRETMMLVAEVNEDGSDLEWVYADSLDADEIRRNVRNICPRPTDIKTCIIESRTGRRG